MATTTARAAARMVVLLAVGTLVLGACNPARWRGDPEAPAVVVIGDSLVFGADGNRQLGDDAHLLSDALVAEGFQAYVKGLVGGRLEHGRTLWDVPARREVDAPDVVVIALGTNDMKLVDGGPQVPLEEARATVREWIAALPIDACVRFVGVVETREAWGLDVTAPAYNDMLAEELDAHPDGEVVSWVPDPSWYPSAGDPHPDDAGDAAYRALIASAAEACAS
jgi:lysophospholipase L1-like esterase